MWFSAGESDQPICMYELGRHLALKPSDRIVIGVEEGYKRKEDVYIQTGLVHPEIKITNNLTEHAINIINACKII